MKFGTKAHCFTRDSGDFCLAGSRKPGNVFPSIHPSSAVRDEGARDQCLQVHPTHLSGESKDTSSQRDRERQRQGRADRVPCPCDEKFMAVVLFTDFC